MHQSPNPLPPTNVKPISHRRCSPLLFVFLLLSWIALSSSLLGAVGANDAPSHFTYRTTWLGNSFGGGPKWVQNFNDQMQVLPDGTVYLASFWDEGGREVGIYKNGEVIGKLEHTHMRGGFAVAVGGRYAWYAHTSVREDQPTVKAGEARSDKPICYFGVSRYSLDGKPAPFQGGKTSDGNMLVRREALDDQTLIPQGLAANDQLLVVADTVRDQLVVFDVSTLKQIREFEIKKTTRVAFAPDGAIWVLSGGHFEVQVFDPQAAPAKIFRVAEGHDPASPPGQGWQWVAQTLDPFRYPDDLRIHLPGLQCGTEIRRLDGRLFICLRGMWQGVLGLYRVDGDMAMPSVVLSSGVLKAERGGWKANGQPEQGRFFWRDVNGNGQMDPGEYTATEGPTGEYWASDVDAKGDFWQGGRDTGIWRWRFEGLDAHGTPRYNPAPVHYPMPVPITDLLRTEYQPESDTMFITGQTKEHEITGGEWGTVGTEVICYDHWSTNPAPRYRTVLPYERGSIWGESFTVAGDLFFSVIGKTTEVYIYAKSDGRLLGKMKPGPEVHGESGWTDIRDAIRAFRRQDGDYLVFVEEDWKGKCMVYEMADPLRGTAHQNNPVTTWP